jgi:formylglycine-generating enzyme required for sulfatase activity
VAKAQQEWAAALKLPVEMVNKQGIKMRLVPPGAMDLGTPPGQVEDRLVQLVPASREWLWLRDNGPSEQPRRRVTFAEPFYLGATEVTVAQFRAFVDATGYVTKAESSGLGGVRSGKDSSRRNAAFLWKQPGYEQTDAFPVVQVEYADAVAFCKWLSEVDRRPYSLPSQDQWEYACRAGSAERWWWGNDPDGARDAVSAPGPDFTPNPVGQQRPNALGLFDMSGNVAEWCSDENGRFARGGGFVHPIPDGVASATQLEPRDPRADFIGFRVMMTLKVERK